MRAACTSVVVLALLILATTWRSWPSQRPLASSSLVRHASERHSHFVHAVAVTTP